MKTIILSIYITIVIFFLGGCMLEEILTMALPQEGDTVTPIDSTSDTIPEDTIPVDTIVIVPCTSYIEVDTPVFTSFFVNLDSPLTSDTTFYYNNTPVDPNTFFDTIFYNGKNIGGIIYGPNIYGNASVWIRDNAPSGSAKHYLSFSAQGLNFRGALTFDQWWNIIQDKRSAELLRFTNTNFTCEQIIKSLEYFIYQCYKTPDIVDLRPISIGNTCVIPQELKDEYKLRGSTIWE